jgi:hypothetical protein
MPSSETWRRVALVRADVSEEHKVYIIRVETINELGTTLPVIGNWNTLFELLATGNVASCSLDDGGDTFLGSVVSYKATRRHTPEYDILHNSRKDLKSYKLEHNHKSCSLRSKISILSWNDYCVRPWGPPLWSSSQSSWLLTQRSRVRFPTLPDFLSSSGSGTRSTQPLWG